MKVRYDLFLFRQSRMHSPTFISVYETTNESETARIWPRRHVQSLESSGPFLLHNSHISPLSPHPSLHCRLFLTLITILHPPLPPRPLVLHDESVRTKRHDTIVAFLDPGQVIVKPITGRFSSPEDVFRGAPPKGDGTGWNVDAARSLDENETSLAVRHGRPLLQEYSFGDAWLKYAPVVGPESPAGQVARAEALRRYTAGPPYLATALDMHQMALRRYDLAPGIYETFPDRLVELYAFSIAAADLGLTHQLMASVMVSDTSVLEGPNNGGGEGWQLVERIPGGEVCSFPMRGPSS